MWLPSIANAGLADRDTTMCCPTHRDNARIPATRSDSRSLEASPLSINSVWLILRVWTVPSRAACNCEPESRPRRARRLRPGPGTAG